MSNKNIGKWIGKLGIHGARPHSDEDFWAMCPCHSDTKPSLHVYVGVKGNVVMNCFVCGASGKDVCEAVGVPINWLEADGSSEVNPTMSDPKDPGSINHLVIEHMVRTNGRVHGFDDVRCAIVWNESFEVAANAVCCMAKHITGRMDTVSDELVRTLVNAFADRLGSRVMQRLDKEVAASTPEVQE